MRNFTDQQIKITIETLLAKGVDNNNPDPKRRTLYQAMDSGISEVIEAALNAGAEIKNDGPPEERTLDQALEIKQTYLGRYQEANEPQIVELMIGHGAKPKNGLSARDSTLYSALLYYNASDHLPIKQVLEAGAIVQDDTLHHAITRTRNPKIVDLVIKAGATIKNDGPVEGRTLYQAVRSGKDLIMNLVILYGASPDSLEDVHPRKEEMLERESAILNSIMKISNLSTTLTANRIERDRGFDKTKNSDAKAKRLLNIIDLPKDVLIEVSKYLVDITPNYYTESMDRMKPGELKITKQQLAKSIKFGEERVSINPETSNVEIRGVTKAEFKDNVIKTL